MISLASDTLASVRRAIRRAPPTRPDRSHGSGRDPYLGGFLPGLRDESRPGTIPAQNTVGPVLRRASHPLHEPLRQPRSSGGRAASPAGTASSVDVSEHG